MRASDLLQPRPEGLYCPPADAYIDAMRPVPRCLITHGHSDHARPGHGAVLATAETLDIMAIRMGEGFAGSRQAIAYGTPMRLNDATLTFVPAGHVLGSAQIVIECRGFRIVVSGDYKRQHDPTSAPFEPVSCDVFLTEATFGLPVFRHPDAGQEIARLIQSLALFPDRPHLLGAYALGKAQRLIALLRAGGYDRPIWLHGALVKLCAYYASRGIDLGDLRPIAGQGKADLAGELILCPPGAMADLWSRRFGDPVTCYASGWMRIRARARQRGVELPLVISDHVDWHDLTRTIVETGCGELWITHGEADALVRWAELRGLPAKPLHLVGYGDEEAE
jgi:putative mRNA 3-end processing factor